MTQPIAYRLVPLACACAALIVVFWALLQLDLPLVRFLRTIHLPWLEVAGDVGNRLGSGMVLAAISGVLGATGLLLKRRVWSRAGLEGLVAHGVAALLVQGLKHLIGRPRPRFAHTGGFQLGPSWETGVDSFPSGHAAASFAVAAVMARRFPSAGAIFYVTASLVAVSRVLRGSHFPSDVAAGTALGLLAGYVVARPIRAWRASLSLALVGLMPYLAGAFALLWAALHAPPEPGMNAITLAAGAMAIAIGAGSRLYFGLRARGAGRGARGASCLAYANALIAVGLALTTGSALVMALVVLVSLAVWLMQPQIESRTDSTPPAPPGYRAVYAEVLLAIGLGLAVMIIQGLKGVLPLL